MTVTIENGQLIAKIAEKGAELQSLKSRSENLEFIWQADPEYWGKHAPILFPIVGALKEGRYTYEGQEYQLSRHGFARDMEFTVTHQTEDSVTMLLVADDRTRAVYPFEFELSVHYELAGEGLQVRYEVNNPSQREMLFSIGGHPAFNVPLSPELSFEDYYLTFSPMKSRIELPLAGDLINISQRTLGATNTNLRLTHDQFSKDALIYETKGLTSITIASEKSPHSVSVAFNNMPYVGIWTPYPKEAPFLCIEPWAGVADTVDATGELSEKLGIQRLAPGKKYQTKYAIIVK
ncbi:aldose 1-epimerase family protein [Enterococcus asini]|uniref:aldose 1-epimerase family protein n=1 Tax=Enterococcus asini TaxID=57732 RepID=UPI00288D4269|nr:aldose 1-epimerase family protein [Enterococcus asini]MDT2756637.1 aldose 1-epimerase family protein [Enterococcus asini]